jgi:hypothetical protein
MQSYIVRIYRKEEGGLLGVVENPGGREKKAFTDCDELWEILNSPEGEYLTERSKGRKRKVGRTVLRGPSSNRLNRRKR